MSDNLRTSYHSLPGGPALQDYLHSAGAAIDCLDEDCIARQICPCLARLFGAGACLIVRRAGQGQAVEVFSAAAPPAEAAPAWTREVNPPGAVQLFEQVSPAAQAVQYHHAERRLPEELRGFLQSTGAHSLLALPVCPGRPSAYLICAAFLEQQRRFDAQELRLAEEIARQATLLGDRARLYVEMKQRSHALEMLYEASLSLTSSLELEHVLNAILKSTFGLMQVALDTHIFLYEQDRLVFGAALDANGATGKPAPAPRQNGLTYAVARSGQPIVVQDMKTHPLFKDAPPSWQGAIVGLPLKMGQRVVGVMAIALPVDYPVSEADLRILRLLGDQAAIAIENARLHRIINQQAHTDVLTGLPNRRSFDERLAEEMRRSTRYHHPFALAMLDLNEFKAINDRYGHLVGDEVLRQLGACLRKSIRDTDFLARYGGDEFAVIFRETDMPTARSVAKRIHEQLRDFSPQLPDEYDFEPFTVALGIAIYPEQAATEEELIRAADRALYHQKRS